MATASRARAQWLLYVPSPSQACGLFKAETRIDKPGSPLCFILASYNYPGAIRSTWGRMAEELDDATWMLLNGEGVGQPDLGLSMLLKMTRLHDLGLAQLCLPELNIDEEIYSTSDSANRSYKGMHDTDVESSQVKPLVS